MNGMQVVAVPVSVTNHKGEAGGLNMFYVSSYGSQGTTLDCFFSYFDDGMDVYKDVRDGATTSGSIYIPYDGNGAYYLEFATLGGKKTEVEIPVEL